MSKSISFFLLVIILVSCKKEDDNIIWQRSFGQGNAFFIETAPDSGILSCGTILDKPYMVKLTKEKSLETDYSSDRDGLFSSVWSDTICYIAAGGSNGKMLLARIDKNGSKVWDTTIVAGFYLDITSLVYTGNGNFLAVGSASQDSSDNGASGILFIRFDTTGNIIENNEITGPDFVSASNVAVDGSGNIYLPLTRKSGSQKPKALVVKYNSDIQKLWETELYNNPDFAAACYDVVVNGPDNIYATGKTEAANASGTLDNSFLVSLSRSGAVNWKKYLENSNTGSAVIINDSEGLMMLNRNCFIIRKAEILDGSEAGTIRMFSECDSYTTDAFGSDMNFYYDGNILAAGSLGGNFYLALKSSQ
jgi:hypothetical protein